MKDYHKEGKKQEWQEKKVWSLIPFGLIKMCLFGVFCSSLPGKKEILQFKSLKSSFTEIHMCNIAYKWADLKRLQKINFKKPFLKPYARRSPHLVSISSSRSINAGTTRQLTWQWRRSLLQSEVVSAGKVTVHFGILRATQMNVNISL